MSATPFPLTFTPIKLGKVAIANRIVLTGHGTGMGRDMKPDDQLIAYYAERAKGGVGLLMIGSQQVHPTSPGITNLLCNYDDAIVPGLRKLAAAIHDHGAACFGYLSHMGLASSARPLPLWSASAVFEQKYGEVAHAMTHAEIAELIAAYRAAALRNLDAGMDGIEVHCGHGLLLNQFLSPLTNRRNDEYGGSVENRVRFPAEILAAVRAAIGPDVPLGIRVSGDELIEGGLTLADMIVIVPLLVAAGRLDYVDVSAGNDGDLVSNMLHEPPMNTPDAPFAPVAATLRKVAGVPIIHGTRIRNAAVGERMLAAGQADMIGMCRPLIADPHLPAKSRAGRADTVSPCIGCVQACLGRLFRGRHISCVGNPVTGRELDWATLGPAAATRRVVVIGGGPAGMEAALVARRRGHDVVLFERERQLGGLIRIAARAPFRQEWTELLDFKARACAAAGVELRLGVAADITQVTAERPDAVIVATGSLPSRPAIEGADLAFATTANEVLAGSARPGTRVVVVDQTHRMHAPSVALHLAENGHAVEIVTESTHVGSKLEIQNMTFMTRELMRHAIRLTPFTAVAALEPRSVWTRNVMTGEVASIDEVDSVVFATPGRADDALVTALAGIAPELHAIGDCYTPRDVEAAILEGHRIGRAL